MLDILQPILKVVTENREFKIGEFIQQLQERLEKMEENYTVDRIENEFAVCENRNTKEMIEVLRKDLPEGIKEGDVLVKIEGKYYLCEEEQQETEKRINEKMNRLWE